MGSFFIYKSSDSTVQENLSVVKNIFRQKGLPDPLSFKLGEHTLLLYPKIALPSMQTCRAKNEDQLFVCGTLSYKGKTFENGIDELFNDFLSSTVADNELRGNYVIITYINNQITIYTDKSNIYNIYYNSDKSILSNSLLATLHGIGKRVEYDTMSIAENLLLGYLIGPDTFFKNIKRYDVKHPLDFPGIHLHSFSYPLVKQPFRTRKEAINKQVNQLHTYFNHTKNIADEFGVDSGITSGHDSRLNMALMRQHWNNISFHSHYRKIKDKEVKIATQVCEKAGVKNNQVEVKRPIEMSENELRDNMQNAFLFFDGHVKLHAFYTEGYNTSTYRAKLLGDRKIGVSGIAGEMYRNEEEMIFPYWSFKTYLRYKIVYNYCGRVIKNLSFERSFFNRLENKIRHAIDIQNKHFITRKNVKQYLIHIFIPSCLGSRNNAENTLSLFFSPYTDPNVAANALAASEWLGWGYTFQQELIRTIDRDLASIMSDYGYNFIEGEPVKKRIMNFIKEFIPESVKQRIIERKYQHSNELFDELYKKSELIRQCYKAVEDLNLPIDLQKLKNRADKAPIIIGIGYVLLQTSELTK
jgi:hypothetical protein